jgi:peptidyl-prolyl cis-trans isomerase D
VVEKIASAPLFQRNGVFDKRTYDYIVTNVFRTSPREFEESIRDDIIIDKLVTSVVGDVELTDDEVRKEYEAENELADLSFILIRPEDYKDKVSVNEDELLSFYNENKQDFQSPVMVDVAYLRIPFGEEKDETLYLAEEILYYIKSGKSLKEASGEYNIELKETGLFSINSAIPEIGLSYPFILSAMRLKEGEISDIVETKDSFCILQLKSRKLPQPLPFEETREQVRQVLILKKAQEKAEEKAQEIIAQIKEENQTLEQAAKTLNIDISKAEKVSRKSYIEGIGISGPFAEVAFSLKEGEIGGPVKTQAGYAIVRLESIAPVDEDKFTEEKEAFANALLEKKQAGKFQEWFMELKEKADLVDNISAG